MSRSRSSQRPLRPKVALLQSRRRSLRLEELEDRRLMARAPFTGLGAIGDDLTDEYGPNGVTYAKSWLELLIANRGLNAGANTADNNPTGETPWPDVRGAGFEFNWAMKGANSLNAVTDQNGGLLGQITGADDPISHAVVMVGLNDFTNVPSIFDVDETSRPYNSIYNNVWNDEFLASYVDFETSILNTLIETLAAQHDAKVLVATIPDPGDFPAFRDNSATNNVAKRQRVASTIETINTRIRIAAEEKHLPIIDLYGLSKALFGTAQAPLESRTIGGVQFTHSGGVGATNMFVAGGDVRPHTIIQTAIANLVMAGFNRGYGENLPLFSEAEMVQLAGLTPTGGNTLNLNWDSFVTLPNTVVQLDFGKTTTPENSFQARINEKASALGISALSDTEVQQIQSTIETRVRAALATVGPNVDVVTADPQGARFHRVSFGIAGSQVNSGEWPRNAVVGSFKQDWQNFDGFGQGYLFAGDLTLPGIAALPRADQLNYIAKALSFYSVQGIGLMFGLDHADAFGYRAISPANYANTGGVQLNDYMSGDPALGFDPAVFQATTAFSLSPLAEAKLKFALGLQDNPLPSTAESAVPHSSTVSPQAVSLQLTGGSMRAGNVEDATISAAGEKDVYAITAQAGDLITAQTLATLVHVFAPANFDTVLKLYAPDGVTLLATSDDILLGANSFGQTGTTTADTDSLILNYPVTSGGTYYLEVSGRDGTTGKYDLFLAADSAASTPWRNAVNNLDVNGDNFVSGIDALQIINELNARFYADPVSGLLPAPANGAPPPYLDVNGDGFAVALDALIIINFLNSGLNLGLPAGGEGEAGPLSILTTDVAGRTLPANEPPAAEGSTLAAIGDLGQHEGTLPLELPSDRPAPASPAVSHVAATDWIFAASVHISEDEADDRATDEENSALTDLLIAPLSARE